jgi:hypothetical protein
MHSLFKRQRTPAELVTKCCNSFEELARAAQSGVAPSQSARERQAPAPAAAQPSAQSSDHVVKYVSEMRVIFFGEAGGVPIRIASSSWRS